MIGPYLPREEIALRIFCALIPEGATLSPAGEHSRGENEIRLSFLLAETFERISHEVGQRPYRSSGKLPRFVTGDEED
jgi:hypothetical protein